MSDKEYMECSVVAYPREIRFLHINGSTISYCVDRHISDYVDRLQQKNQELQKENEKNKHYKTLYQSLKKQKEELRKWCIERYDYIVFKMEELEGINDE